MDRGVKMLMKKGQIDSYDHAKSLLLQYGSVKDAIEKLHKQHN